MPRKGINLCPKCGAGGCAFGDPATLLVACRKCGHKWKTRSREAKQRARRMLSNADVEAGGQQTGMAERAGDALYLSTANTTGEAVLPAKGDA